MAWREAKDQNDETPRGALAWRTATNDVHKAIAARAHALSLFCRYPLIASGGLQRATAGGPEVRCATAASLPKVSPDETQDFCD
jgi:hypothetical protein